MAVAVSLPGMLSYNELKIGTMFKFEGTPYEVLDYEFLRMQQRKPVAKTRIKNLLNGQVTERNFHQNEAISEIEIDKKPITFLYSNRPASTRLAHQSEAGGEFWF